jgi:geranylgeranyl diphosphate synthase type I
MWGLLVSVAITSGEVDMAPALLARAGWLRNWLRQSAPGGTWLRRMAGYHMGWLASDGRPAGSSPGKLMRPALALWACHACGGEQRLAAPVATALEWIHNFTLVHDDIQDGDRLRRHRPTIWAIWGPGQGINAGDGMHATAFRLLVSQGPAPRRRLLAARIIAEAVLELIEGQCLDLSREGQPQTSPATYRRLATAKTGALLGASLEAGAVTAGARPAARRNLRRAGRLLGLAFQYRDDWLGTWGDSHSTGKSADGDLARRKLTYPIVCAYAKASPAQRSELRRLYRLPGTHGSERIRELLDELGMRAFTESESRRAAEAAVEAVASCGFERTAVAEFEELARFVASRAA